MTRTQLRTEILYLLNDPSGIRFGTTQLNTWIDLANLDAIVRLGPFDVSSQTDTLDGSDTFASSQPNYQLNANTIFLKELFLETQAGEDRKIEIITQEELATRYGGQWADNISANLGEPSVAYRVDYNVFGVYPRPNANNNGKTYRAYYYRVPDAFASDSSTPIFLDSLHDCLSWFCASRGHWQMGDREASEQALARYKILIKEFYSTATKFAKEMQGFRWGVV